MSFKRVKRAPAWDFKIVFNCLTFMFLVLTVLEPLTILYGAIDWTAAGTFFKPKMINSWKALASVTEYLYSDWSSLLTLMAALKAAKMFLINFKVGSASSFFAHSLTSFNVTSILSSPRSSS
ncbi:hypothetical protein WICPIJ_000120 [Wickerhamomyces pijperi]|uniref:Uncharacterized protein n=1 Tax=Wickerhamomyces pijperi TaxID=599730 RepID=A0A9P8QHN3_WICPI|nr:hypothetical protein WICPIJ_000120 [Wickerhamomyces pijperi]